ncbi:nucleobase:cation symporter-2 family protein [Castellaniella caeni]
MLVLAIQHLAVSYIGAVAVPLIIASALQLSQADTITLISTTLFCTGIATLLQTIGIWKFGARLPILNGVAFSSVGPIIATGTMPGVGLAGVCGAVIAGGLFIILAAPYVGRLRRLFPPVVTGCIVTVIGASLFPVAYEWMGGGRGNSNFGAPGFLVVSFGVLGVILLLNRFGSPFIRNMAVLIGMALGTIAAYAMGMGDYSSVTEAPWVTIPYPFYFGAPVFALIPILSMIVVMIVQMVESMGLFLAIGDICKRKVDEKEITEGLRANGLASAIAGMFAAFPFIAFMENVGLIILSGVRSRWVVALCGLMMCVVAMVPKLGAILAATPVAALGGAALAMFGVVVAAGIHTLSKVDYENNNNVLIVGFTLVISLIPVLTPAVFKQMPEWNTPFLHSGVVIACIVSVLMNLVLNGLGKPAHQTEDQAVSETAPDNCQPSAAISE